MDREWSSQPLGPDQTGWDWFSLHLNSGEKLMLYRLRQQDGRNDLMGNWIAADGRSVEIASADNSITPTVCNRRRRPQGADRMARRHSRPRPCDRNHGAEREELDGHQLSLLGGPDQLCRQPRRIRISGDDRVLARGTSFRDGREGSRPGISRFRVRCFASPRNDVPEFRGTLAMYHFTALVTCLAILFYFFTGIQVSKARVGVRHQGAGDLGPSRFRAGVSRADEHAGMDADFPALALAVCDLHQRSLRGRAWPDLDRRPHSLPDRLFAGRRQTRPRVLRFRRLPPSSSGPARWARSCGGSFRGEGVRDSVGARSPDAAQRPLRCAADPGSMPTKWVPALRCTVEVTLHRGRDTVAAITSSAGTRYPSPTGTPCRPAPPRAACSSPRAFSTPTAS